MAASFVTTVTSTSSSASAEIESFVQVTRLLWSTLQDLWLTRKPTVLLVTHDLREAVYLSTRIVVLSARPGRVIDDNNVDFPRPRTIEMNCLAG